MTDIKFLKDRIIIDGHADTKEQCETITLLCDNLAKSKDFKTVRYESGYAEFVKVGKANDLKFAAAFANVTVIFDSHIEKVVGRFKKNSQSSSSELIDVEFTQSGQNSSEYSAVDGDDYPFTVTLESGYVIDTITLSNTDEMNGILKSQTDTGFVITAGASGIYQTITITTKQSTSDNLTWVINETPTISSTQPTQETPFKSNNEDFIQIVLLKNQLRYVTHNVEYITVYTSETGWLNKNYRTIMFSEGVTDEILYSWLEQNATQVTPWGKRQIDLSTFSWWTEFEVGSHSVYIVAKASGYLDSSPSNDVTVSKDIEGGKYNVNFVLTDDSSGVVSPCSLQYSIDHGVTWHDLIRNSGYTAVELLVNDLKNVDTINLQGTVNSEAPTTIEISSTLLSFSISTGQTDVSGGEVTLTSDLTINITVNTNY